LPEGSGYKPDMSDIKLSSVMPKVFMKLSKQLKSQSPIHTKSLLQAFELIQQILNSLLCFCLQKLKNFLEILLPEKFSCI
jgi:hypothetical protein